MKIKIDLDLDLSARQKSIIRSAGVAGAVIGAPGVGVAGGVGRYGRFAAGRPTPAPTCLFSVGVA